MSQSIWLLSAGERERGSVKPTCTSRTQINESDSLEFQCRRERAALLEQEMDSLDSVSVCICVQEALTFSFTIPSLSPAEEWTWFG